MAYIMLEVAVLLYWNPVSKMHTKLTIVHACYVPRNKIQIVFTVNVKLS